MQYIDKLGVQIERGDFIIYHTDFGGQFYRVDRFYPESGWLGAYRAHPVNGVLECHDDKISKIKFPRESIICPKNLNLLSDRQYRGSIS